MFMGDAEANLLDFVAFFTIKFFWNLDGVTEHHPWVSLILTLTALTPRQIH